MWKKTNTDTIVNSFNAAVPEAVGDIFRRHNPVKKCWVSADILDLCIKRRELKTKGNEQQKQNITT